MNDPETQKFLELRGEMVASFTSLSELAAKGDSPERMAKVAEAVKLIAESETLTDLEARVAFLDKLYLISKDLSGMLHAENVLAFLGQRGAHLQDVNAQAIAVGLKLSRVLVDNTMGYLVKEGRVGEWKNSHWNSRYSLRVDDKRGQVLGIVNAAGAIYLNFYERGVCAGDRLMAATGLSAVELLALSFTLAAEGCLRVTVSRSWVIALHPNE